MSRKTPPFFRLLAAGPVLAALLLSAPAAAQVRPDTTRRDSVTVPIPPGAVADDTLPDKAVHDTTATDSIGPAPNFPAWPRRGGGSWSGSWTWSREALAFFHNLSLVELLERVPGLLVTRTGSFGQPAGVSAYGLGGGRLRLFVDGWEAAPLGSATPDLQQLALVDLDEVRVERSLAETRVYVTTFRLPDERPYALLEAADGDFNTRILRGMFARTLGSSTIVQGIYDLVDTNGFARQQPYSATTMGARVSRMFGPDRGVQVEFRRLALDRDGEEDESFFNESVDRTDLVVRGTWRRGLLRLDGLAGHSRRARAGADSTALEGSAAQAALSATYQLPFGTVAGTARTILGGDEAFAANQTELSVRAELAPAGALAATGEVRALTLGGVAGFEAEGAVRFSPLGGLNLFGEIAAGTRGLRLARDSLLQRRTFAGLDTTQTEFESVLVRGFGTTESSVSGLRAGAEWSRGSASLGAALVRSDAERIAPFGLGWDVGLPPTTDAGAMTGVEVYGSVPVLREWLRLDGWYLRSLDTGDRPYLPADLARAAAEVHRVFFEGNLEPTFRLEALVRGPARTLAATENGVEFAGVTERYLFFNAFLQIRILDVRAFLLAENVFDWRPAADIPGLPLPGARTVYGFRWFLRN